MPHFDVERFRRMLRTRVLGQICYSFDVLASTNTFMHRQGRLGAPEGTIVLADGQTAGRGQGDRVWISTARCNLYVSVLLRPAIIPAQAPLLSLLTAIALVDTLRQEGAACGIKWPNDVLIGQHKVAGILTEMDIQHDAVRFVVVGIGINVNMTQEDLEQHLGSVAQTATSLRVSLGRELCREALLATFMDNLEQWYDRFSTRGESVVHEAWETRSVICGRRITAHTAATTWEGVAEGIDLGGRLRLRQDDGVLVTLTSAQVRVVD